MLNILKSYADCTACSLWGNPAAILDTNVTNLTDADVIFIGENPGRVEIHRMIPFVGKSGMYFRYVAENILRDFKWIITNVVLCSTIEDKITVNPAIDNINKCCVNALQLILQVKPMLIVLLGRSAVIGLLHKSIIGNPMVDLVDRFCALKEPTYTGKTFVTYHPRYVLGSSKRERDNYNRMFKTVYSYLRENQKTKIITTIITKEDFIKLCIETSVL